MKVEITKTQIDQATGESEWDCLNKVLYEMCRNMPSHEKEEVAIAKIMIIGRTYAAAIERKRKVDHQNDDFYVKRVGPMMRDSKLDLYLSQMERHSVINAGNYKEIITAHKHINDIFKDIAGNNGERRSLASKYLHFHFPNLFFIYDSRACAAIRKITKPKKINKTKLSNCDEEYAMFVLRCLELQEYINSKYQIPLSPRQIDKILLSY